MHGLTKIIRGYLSTTNTIQVIAESRCVVILIVLMLLKYLLPKTKEYRQSPRNNRS